MLDRKFTPIIAPAAGSRRGNRDAAQEGVCGLFAQRRRRRPAEPDLEEKALSTAVAAEGGYLVDPQTASEIVGVLRSAASIRTIANVVTVEATAFDVLVDHSDIGAGWATETTATSETGTPQVDRISIPLHELSALPKASQRLLDDSAFDVEGWLAQRIADKFSRAEAQAFISGDGVDKPTGFLKYPKVDTDLWAWGSLGYVPTGAAGDFSGSDPSDAVVDLVYALGARYRTNATFVMNSKTAGAVRKMKDADGRFLWSDGLAAGEPARLMGYPVLICEDMPDIGRQCLSRSPSAISARAIPLPSARTFGSCGTRFRPSRMCCSMRPSASAATSATLRRSSF